MPEKLNLAARLGSRRGVTFLSLLLTGALAFAGLFCCASFTGCSGTSAASVAAKAQTIETAIVADASSPAGQQLLGDVTSTALNVGLDAASGNDVGAAIAGVQGAAQAVRDYEGLPTAPSAATVAQAAAAGSGVAHVATTLAPAIETIIGNAVKSAKTQKIAVTTDQITEALARGFDLVAAAKDTSGVTP